MSKLMRLFRTAGVDYKNHYPSCITGPDVDADANGKVNQYATQYIMIAI